MSTSLNEAPSNATLDPPLEMSLTAPPSSEVELVLARFRLLALRRAAWLQHIWSQEDSAGAPGSVSHAEVAAILTDRDAPEVEAKWLAGYEPAQGWDAELSEIDEQLAQLENGRFARLARIFGLTHADLDLLQACAAVAWDPTLARVAAYLHDQASQAYITEPLVARLYGHGRAGIWSAQSSLFVWELLRGRETDPGVSRALECDPQIRDWLRGYTSLDPAIAGVVGPQLPLPPLADWPVESCVDWLQAVLKENPAARARLIISGPRGSGRRTLAAVIAERVNLPLLLADADAITDADWRSVFLHVQRQCFLDTRAVAWLGEALTRRGWPKHVTGFPVQFLICEPGQEPPPLTGVVERRIRLSSPGMVERERLWRLHLPATRAWPEKDVLALAERHRTQPGDIASAGRLGLSTPAQAGEAVRELARGRLAGLAQQLECPFTWNDLVLPAETNGALQAIAYEAEQHATFWEQPQARRLFPQGQGLLALFTGHPGTGKTMAAQVIAAHLKQDLFRVNLAQYVSKWVGETAKHCERLLDQAAEMDAVLFFDEADAIFAKRSSEMRDAQDRFANTDAAHLLQAIESYRGIAFLATNLKNNIDPAFFRRLRYVVEFAKPDAAHRRQLWDKLMLELAGETRHRQLAPALDAIAASVEATAAQTKYALLGALFVARRERAELSTRHLLIGLENELGKEGRAIGPRDRDRILKSSPTP